jgi:PIN domain nuclease of toxin-antitoxin system
VEKARKAIRVSSISVWELLVLIKKGRLELAVPPRVFLRNAERISYIDYVPVDNQIARGSVELPDLHADAADRIVVATALTLGCPLVSRDAKLGEYPGVERVW